MEINNVKFSVAKKMTLLIASIVSAFLAIALYAGSHLLEVGDAIMDMQEVDLPAMERLSEIGQYVIERHALSEKMHLHRVRGSTDVAQMQAYRARFDELAVLQLKVIDEKTGERGADDLAALFGKMSGKFALTGAADVKRLVDLNNNATAIVHSYFDTEGSVEDLSTWAPVDAMFEEIDDLVESMVAHTLEHNKEGAQLLMEDEQELIKFVSVAIVLIVIFSGFFAWRIIQSISRPLVGIAKHSLRIAGGDLSGEPYDVHTSDELSVLAHSFKVMQDNMREQVGDLKKSIETVGVSIQQTGASIQEQASSSKEEAATIQEITTTMQEIQQSGVEIGQRAKEVSDASDENLRACEGGLQAVETTSQSMSLIREQVEEVAEKIVNLSDKTQAIGDIVSTVNDIAEQSNILAINASIEAASAGENGSRFSIVAQEMKNLADQAKDCTRQVRSILGDIQKGINTSVMLTEEAVKRSDVGKEQSEIADQTIRNLLETTQANMDAFQQIMAGTNQQQIGVDQVAQGMRDIRQAVQQTVAGISELEQAMGNLNAMSDQLKGSINKYTL